MNKKEMIQAMLDGKILVNDYAKAYYDDSLGYPFRYRYNGCRSESLILWKGDWQIKEEPEPITDRLELIKQIMDRRDSGEQFLVRAHSGYWTVPETFSYISSHFENYEWTAVDDTGHPIGEPQKFVKEIDNK